MAEDDRIAGKMLAVSSVRHALVAAPKLPPSLNYVASRPRSPQTVLGS